MADDLKSKTGNINIHQSLENQLESVFYPNSAYRSSMKQTQLTVEIPAGIVIKYINGMVAYDALRSEENYKYLEELKKENKDFLESN